MLAAPLAIEFRGPQTFIMGYLHRRSESRGFNLEYYTEIKKHNNKRMRAVHQGNLRQ